MIVDSHVHIADELAGLTGSGPTRSLSYGRARWGADEFQFLTPCSNPTGFSAETLLRHLDWAGVDKAVVLQGPFYGDKTASSPRRSNAGRTGSPAPATSTRAPRTPSSRSGAPSTTSDSGS